ncbi:hypothetical protein SO802_027826 [Lithocarpus litseifolius]|uniref:J domain-containing protein n=1 Tax=Lithocarpus litseifolius TaxID=425828 RepID=A0AAW2BR29_9ROSI
MGAWFLLELVMQPTGREGPPILHGRRRVPHPQEYNLIKVKLEVLWTQFVFGSNQDLRGERAEEDPDDKTGKNVLWTLFVTGKNPDDKTIGGESWLQGLIRERTKGEAPLSSTSAYAVLGVEPDCSAAELKAAFRAKVKQFHPDVNRDGADSDSMIRRVIEAYEHMKVKQN